MQTNGTLLTDEKIKKLEEAGLDHMNISIDAVKIEQGAYLRGCGTYNVQKVIETAKKVNESKIELLIAPVWLPKVNDDGIKELIKLAKELGCKIGIQKYDIYKYGRKMKEVKKINWWKFYKQLEDWEKEFGIQLKISAKDFEIEKRERMPEVFEKGEKIQAKIVALGWQKGQMLGVAENRCISINGCLAEIGDKVNVKILETKNNIYVAEIPRKKQMMKLLELENPF